MNIKLVVIGVCLLVVCGLVAAMALGDKASKAKPKPTTTTTRATTTTTTTQATTTTTTTTQPTTTLVNSCSDTDGGLNPLVLGTVSGVNYGQQYSHTDLCNNTIMLLEYACSGNISYGAPVFCDMNYTGCANGACYI